jgi:hypothetical protein
MLHAAQHLTMVFTFQPHDDVFITATLFLHVYPTLPISTIALLGSPAIRLRGPICPICPRLHNDFPANMSLQALVENELKNSNYAAMYWGLDLGSTGINVRRPFSTARRRSLATYGPASLSSPAHGLAIDHHPLISLG